MQDQLFHIVYLKSFLSVSYFIDQSLRQNWVLSYFGRVFGSRGTLLAKQFSKAFYSVALLNTVYPYQCKRPTNPLETVVAYFKHNNCNRKQRSRCYVKLAHSHILAWKLRYNSNNVQFSKLICHVDNCLATKNITTEF